MAAIQSLGDGGENHERGGQCLEPNMKLEQRLKSNVNCNPAQKRTLQPKAGVSVIFLKYFMIMLPCLISGSEDGLASRRN
jgi:hypothetical protein